jgi:hypothetical protein
MGASPYSYFTPSTGSVHELLTPIEHNHDMNRRYSDILRKIVDFAPMNTGVIITAVKGVCIE